MISDLRKIIELHKDPSKSLLEKVNSLCESYNLYFTTEQDLVGFFSAPIIPIAKQIAVMSTDSNGNTYENCHIYDCNVEDTEYIKAFSESFCKLLLDLGYNPTYDEIHLLDEDYCNDQTDAIDRMYHRLENIDIKYKNIVLGKHKGIRFYSDWMCDTYSNFGTGTDAYDYHYILVA